MLKTFNCGVGLILIAKVEDSKEITNFLQNKKIKYYILGNVSKKNNSKNKVLIKNFGEWDLT